MFKNRKSADKTLSRRDWLRLSALGALGGSLSGWLPALAAETANSPQRKRSCILLWMSGGPSQIDTFDLKPDHENGGKFKPIDTAAPGVQISEHLPQMAQVMQHVAPIRSMTTKEGDHSRGTYLMRTGRPPSGPVQYPTLGSFLSKELSAAEAELPDFVSIAPYRILNAAAYSPGFLGSRHAPLIVGDSQAAPQGDGDRYEQSLKVKNLDLPGGVDLAQADARLAILKEFEADHISRRPSDFASSHQSAYHQAVRMMRSAAVKAFSLDDEPAKLRDAYGRNQFGQGCLLARRLIEREVPFVEVSLNNVAGSAGLGWDSHRNNFPAVQGLCDVLDPAWATLISDLKDRGLLESTLIVWMGEFGRTPKINRGSGRDHFPAAWTTVLSGGGIQGGQVVGATSADGMHIQDHPVPVRDLMATICRALGIDPQKQNMSNVGRPIRLTDPNAVAIKEILA
ncbi:hypothetical protein CA54_21950 [Symmachiella macrocystis]|uniref:Sulfatase n=1 Tax=Symmachiella macrocystis TaxID=2527985 RepID=A0A5C6BMI4_9PLAN|nr:DUF1501 domain-containing protein [Symmachiella macrocystis]TWU13360.1 hypothetical protein CA54_21950 [Symmachiella macrocystis]